MAQGSRQEHGQADGSVNSPAKKRIVSRPFIDEPQFLVHYAPLAEKMLNLAFSTDIPDNHLSAFAVRAAGHTAQETAEIESAGEATVKKWERKLLQELSLADPSLVASYRELRHTKQSEKERRSRKIAHDAEPAIEERRRKKARDYYFNHKKSLREWSRKHAHAYMQRPGVRERYAQHSRNSRIRAKECRSYANMLGHPDPSNRAEAAMAIGARRYKGHFEKLRRMLLSDPESFVRCEAAWALGETREWRAVNILVRAAESAHRSENAPLLCSALMALGKLGLPEAKEAVRSHLGSRDEAVRSAAIRALAWKWKKTRSG
ncbi:HEAT repeats [uncultured archaeon]|nr:HEAT repeats [uncultured archaeon]